MKQCVLLGCPAALLFEKLQSPDGPLFGKSAHHFRDELLSYWSWEKYYRVEIYKPFISGWVSIGPDGNFMLSFIFTPSNVEATTIAGFFSFDGWSTAHQTKFPLKLFLVDLTNFVTFCNQQFSKNIKNTDVALPDVSFWNKYFLKRSRMNWLVFF